MKQGWRKADDDDAEQLAAARRYAQDFLNRTRATIDRVLQTVEDYLAGAETGRTVIGELEQVAQYVENDVLPLADPQEIVAAVQELIDGDRTGWLKAARLPGNLLAQEVYRRLEHGEKALQQAEAWLSAQQTDRLEQLLAELQRGSTCP